MHIYKVPKPELHIDDIKAKLIGQVSSMDYQAQCAWVECDELTCPISCGFYVINVQLWLRDFVDMHQTKVLTAALTVLWCTRITRYCLIVRVHLYRLLCIAAACGIRHTACLHVCNKLR